MTTAATTRHDRDLGRPSSPPAEWCDRPHVGSYETELIAGLEETLARLSERTAVLLELVHAARARP